MIAYLYTGYSTCKMGKKETLIGLSGIGRKI
jgi:hypothetical protein